jgi:DegV family protein with EDD domain
MIGIITDSTCDIPEAMLEPYGIVVVPQVVTWGDQQYRDRIDLQPGQFYQRLANDPVRPHSSLPSLANFLEAYKCAADRGASELIVLTVSSAMSGTYEMAKTAANHISIPVTVVDSKGPSMSLGWQVLAAARARQAGADRASILAQVERVRQRLALMVGMETLEYLQKGGRIGAAAKWAGALLHVRPVVAINHHTGVVEPVSLVRTHKALVDLLYHKFFEQMQGGKALAERIRSEYNPCELLINITGPVLGINTGPGALALCGYGEA